MYFNRRIQPVSLMWVIAGSVNASITTSYSIVSSLPVKQLFFPVRFGGGKSLTSFNLFCFGKVLVSLQHCVNRFIKVRGRGVG